MNSSLVLLWTFLTCAIVISALPVNFNSPVTSVSQPKPGAPLDEVIVESSLHITNKKSQPRRTRDTQELAVVAIDKNGLAVKRQRRSRHQIKNSQSSANAGAFGNYLNSNGFGASAAKAQV